jgi:MarR family
MSNERKAPMAAASISKTYIIRRPFANNFTTFSNDDYERGLSLAAIGLLHYLIGLPSNWKVITNQLAQKFGHHPETIRGLLNELIAAGYVRRSRCRDGTVQYIVANDPNTEKPCVAQADPNTEKACLAPKHGKSLEGKNRAYTKETKNYQVRTEKQVSSPNTHSAPTALALVDGHMNGHQLEAKEAKEASGCPNKEASEASFERFWQAYPKRDGSNPRKPAADKFKSLIERHKVSPEAIVRGAQRYAESVEELEGQERRYIKQAITFLNQDGWKDEHPKRERNRSYMEMADDMRAERLGMAGNGHDDAQPPDFDFDLGTDDYRVH